MKLISLLRSEFVTSNICDYLAIASDNLILNIRSRPFLLTYHQFIVHSIKQRGLI
jgi:hypothetical protein